MEGLNEKSYQQRLQDVKEQLSIEGSARLIIDSKRTKERLIHDLSDVAIYFSLFDYIVLKDSEHNMKLLIYSMIVLPSCILLLGIPIYYIYVINFGLIVSVLSLVSICILCYVIFTIVCNKVDKCIKENAKKYRDKLI